ALLSHPSPQLVYAIPWWGATHDSGNLRRAAAALETIARVRVPPSDAALLSLGEREVPAYLALARRDSAAALALLAAIPDSLCDAVESAPRRSACCPRAPSRSARRSACRRNCSGRTCWSG